MSLTDATPDVRADVLAAIVAALERGIVVERPGYSPVRIRLADEPATDSGVEGTGPTVTAW